MIITIYGHGGPPGRRFYARMTPQSLSSTQSRWPSTQTFLSKKHRKNREILSHSRWLFSDVIFQPCVGVIRFDFRSFVGLSGLLKVHPSPGDVAQDVTVLYSAGAEV